MNILIMKQALRILEQYCLIDNALKEGFYQVDGELEIGGKSPG